MQTKRLRVNNRLDPQLTNQISNRTVITRARRRSLVNAQRSRTNSTGMNQVTTTRAGRHNVVVRRHTRTLHPPPVRLIRNKQTTVQVKSTILNAHRLLTQGRRQRANHKRRSTNNRAINTCRVHTKLILNIMISVHKRSTRQDARLIPRNRVIINKGMLSRLPRTNNFTRHTTPNVLNVTSILDMVNNNANRMSKGPLMRRITTRNISHKVTRHTSPQTRMERTTLINRGHTKFRHNFPNNPELTIRRSYNTIKRLIRHNTSSIRHLRIGRTRRIRSRTISVMFTDPMSRQVRGMFTRRQVFNNRVIHTNQAINRHTINTTTRHMAKSRTLRPIINKRRIIMSRIRSRFSTNHIR